jgi:hypothetical protein
MEVLNTKSQSEKIIDNRLENNDKKATFEPLVDAVKAEPNSVGARQALVGALKADGVTKHLADRAVEHLAKEAIKASKAQGL